MSGNKLTEQGTGRIKIPGAPNRDTACVQMSV